MNINLRVMMPLSLLGLFCQCTILLLSFEGIVCPFLDFVIENLSIADIYKSVEVEGSYSSGRLIFKKERTADNTNPRPHILRFHSIVRHNMIQEDNCPTIASFSRWGVPHLNYNIEFSTAEQAKYFVQHKALPRTYTILGARIYSNWRPIIMSYDYFVDEDDIGFKLLDNGDYENPDEHVNRLPYLFKRSEIKDEIRTTLPHTLYLRNKFRIRDYRIQFKSTENLSIFLEFFPERIFDDRETADYYFIQCPRNDQ